MRSIINMKAALQIWQGCFCYFDDKLLNQKFACQLDVIGCNYRQGI